MLINTFCIGDIGEDIFINLTTFYHFYKIVA